MWAVIIKVGVGVLIFDPSGFEPFDRAKAVTGLALSVPLAMILLVTFWKHGTETLPRSRLHVCVVAIAVTALASWPFAANGWIALHGARGSYQGLTHLFELIVVYVACAVAFRTERDVMRSLAGLALVTAVVMAYAVAQIAGVDPFEWADVRTLSTLGSPAFLGHWLAVVVAASLGMLLFSSGPAVSRVRAFALGVSLAALSLIAVIATRAAIAALALASVVAGAIQVRSVGLSRALLVRATVVTALAAAALGVALALTPLGPRVEATLAGVGITDRLLLYGVAVEAVSDRPLLGFGPDNFVVAYPRYRQPGSANLLFLISETSAHNFALQAAANTGLLGLAAGLAFAAGILGRLLARRPGGPQTALAALTLAVVAYWTYALLSPEVVSLTWIPWYVGGVAIGITHSAEFAERTRRGPTRAVEAVALAVSVVVALSATNALQADREARLSADLRATGAVAPAIQHGQAAVSRDPDRGHYWSALGLAYVAAQRWSQAAGAFETAVRLEPHDVTHASNRARARLLEALSPGAPPDARARAREAAQAAIDTDPADPEPWFVYAQVANALGDHEAALRAAKAAIERFVHSEEYDTEAAAAALQMTDKALAQQLLRETLEVKESPVLRIALAQLVLQTDGEAAAIAELRELLDRHPGYTKALDLLRQLEQ